MEQKDMKLPDKPKQYPTKEGKCICCGQYTKYLNAIELQYVGGTYVDWRCLPCYWGFIESRGIKTY